MACLRCCRIVLPLALLAGCADSAPEDDAAPVDVLEGTISDAMLPLDRVRSQAPLVEPARPRAAAAGGDNAAEGDEEAGSEEAAEAEPATEAESESD